MKETGHLHCLQMRELLWSSKCDRAAHWDLRGRPSTLEFMAAYRSEWKQFFFFFLQYWGLNSGSCAC
jgi:hypothetical protein